jgi:murein DD-endopeptidase MepM/ murein hydrolase activator NlpD
LCRAVRPALVVPLLVVPVTAPAIGDPAEAPVRLMALEPGGATAPGLREWVAGRVSALEGLLERSGLDVEALIERAGEELSSGQGGPLVPALGSPMQAGLAEELERLQRVQTLVAAVPFAAPMATFKLTSGFGVRRDPLARRRALHEGQDFGGPRNAPVLATAPGTVVAAKRAGAYGIMVEIDHGMGIRTRYAHLKKATVRVGQRVEVRQKLGIMGSTGRSTGAHLHYEIRVDGKALDPANFLAAGGELQALVGS